MTPREDSEELEMPRLKRRGIEVRAKHEEDEDRIEPVRKKAKRVTIDNEEAEESEHIDDEVQPVWKPHGTSVSSAQDGAAVVEEDQPEEEEEEDDDDEQQENQVQLTVENGFAHSGILLSVRLDRFMSHECFQFDFGPNVNVIQGPNGSGKSAIVAALQIGFLGSVSATERGRKLDDVIKHGRNDCIISIRIANRKPPKLGEDFTEPDLTYKHEIYGDVITIERKLVRGGGGSFAVKARSRNVKLPKGITFRQEIRAIIDHFGFMVDNPVAVLTQTKSKEFLAKGKPTDHFRLFRQATLLGPLQDELKCTREITQQTSALHNRVNSKLPEAEEDLRKKEMAHREAQEMKHIDTRISSAEAAYAWTLVQEEEIKLQRNEAKTINEFEPVAEKARTDYENSQANIEQRKVEMTKYHEAVNEATTHYETISNQFKEVQKQVSVVKYELHRESRRIREFEGEAEDMGQKVSDTKKRMQLARQDHFAGQEQKARLVEEINQIDSEVSILRQSMAAARTREEALQEKKMPLDDKRLKVRNDIDAMQRDLESKRREQNQVEAAARNKDSVARFGHGFADLCQSIRQHEHKFSRYPIGPVGQFISLDDESWAPTVELALGKNTLRAFIVQNSKDSALLQSLIPRGSIRPLILIANMDRVRYQIRSNDCPQLPNDSCHTILDTLSVNNDAVFNYLVDQSQIERNVLDGSGADVTRLGWSRIANLHSAWNKQCDRAYTRNGSNTFRKGPSRVNAQILTKDMRPYIESVKAEVLAIFENLNNAKKQLHETDSALRDIVDDFQKESRDAARRRSKIAELETRKALLEGKLNQAENAFDPSPFEQEIVALKESLAENEKMYSAAKRKEEELLEQTEHSEERLGTIRIEMREATLKTKQESRNLSAVQAQIAQLKSKDRNLKREYQISAQRVGDAHVELEQQRNAVTATMEAARKVGTCPDNVDPREKSSGQWERDLMALRQRLETEQERRGGRSAAEIEKEYIIAKKKHEDNKQALNRVGFYVKALRRGVKSREILLRELEKGLRKCVRYNFRKFLGTRGHSGTIKFKTQDGQPELHIITRMGTHRMKDGQLFTTKDNRALSGGEKSYTTLCFILALAEICQNPVRVMDEIDVFQDEGTRHASFRTLVTFCTQYLSNRQIIIITPHALPQFDANQAVRIQKLHAPRRGSSRGGRQTAIDQFVPRMDNE